MVELDEEALVNARARSRDRKLSSLEKLAIYAFAVKEACCKRRCSRGCLM